MHANLRAAPLLLALALGACATTDTAGSGSSSPTAPAATTASATQPVENAYAARKLVQQRLEAEGYASKLRIGAASYSNGVWEVPLSSTEGIRVGGAKIGADGRISELKLPRA